LRGTPYLAGSALKMDDAVGNAVRFAGIELTDAIAMASTVPAGYMGMETAGAVTADWDPERCRLHIRSVSDN
jgi:N-acetylglucosamine-6-phosphate deacetylase